jgi:hypothetical protein
MRRSYLISVACCLVAGCGGSVASPVGDAAPALDTETPGDTAVTSDVPPADVVVADAIADVGPVAVSDMSAARALLGSALGKDGRVRVFGGLTPFGVTNTSERYDPASNTWTDGATAKINRYGHATTKDADGNVYVVGGTSNGKTPIPSVERYSPSTDTWTTVAAMPTPRLGLGAAVGGDGLLYAIGGRGVDGIPTDLVEAYSPTTLSWSAVAKLPTARLSLMAITGADKKIYAIGGRDADDVPLDVVEVFDTTTGTWATEKPMTSTRYWFGATLGIDGRIYAVGGIGAASSSSEVDFLATAEAFTPGSGWSALAPLPKARGWLSCAPTADGRILAMGGALVTHSAAQPPPIATVVAYDPKSNKWVDSAP